MIAVAFAASSCEGSEENAMVLDSEGAMECLMSRYGREIKRLCCLQLGDWALAEDAAQETFVKAWRARTSFRGACSEKTWLTRIAVNCCRDIMRGGWLRHLDRRVTPEELPLAAPGQMPDPTLRQALAALPGREREILLLRYYEEMSVGEIATMLSLPLNTVKSRLQRAKKKMKQRLEGWYFDE